MRILKIIHGYPPRYNAGSEVYSQMLCRALAKRHEVHVFTREENPFEPDFSLRLEADGTTGVMLHLINIPQEKFRYRYQHLEVDKALIEVLEGVKPHIVHIGHLNHLSTSLVAELAKRKIPMVYTLHDYWLMCPRGQFIQRNPPANEGLWTLCDGQEHQKCAERCYAGYFSGAMDEEKQDVAYWTDWVKRRMEHIRGLTQHIQMFIAPSHYLYQRYVQDFQLPLKKLLYVDYGFDLNRLENRHRVPHEPFTFGYIGTHIPAKGIQDLLRAFASVKGNSRLRLWGRTRAQNTEGLQSIVKTLPEPIQKRLEWRSEYSNENIVEDVFNQVDCIVVPSIWVENSPLVIHEALQLRIPVITANAGGMAEYVKHEQNGLLFEHRTIQSLATQMQRLAEDPLWAKRLGSRGYLQSSDGNVPSLEEHIDRMETIYHGLLEPSFESLTGVSYGTA
ncbi:MAG: glycosyltransferase [Gammaproteobacteria bacterium]|nr:glycosyltransferase [Gammaproteobacteria bacterium]